MPSRKKINRIRKNYTQSKRSAKLEQDASDMSAIPGVEPQYPIQRNISELTNKFSYTRTFKDISKVITEHTPGGYDLVPKPRPIKRKKNQKEIKRHKPWASDSERTWFMTNYFKWSMKEKYYDPSSMIGSNSSTPTVIPGVRVEPILPGSKRAKDLYKEAKQFARTDRPETREFDVFSCSWFQEEYLSSGANHQVGRRVSNRDRNVYTTEKDLRVREKVKKDDFTLKSVTDILEYENIVMGRDNKHKFNYIKSNTGRDDTNTRECLNYGELCNVNDDQCCDDLYCEDYDSQCHAAGAPDVLGQPFWWNAIDYVLRGKCDGQVMPDWVDCDENHPNYERRPFVCGHSLGEAAAGGYGCFPLRDYDQDGVISLVDVQAIMCTIEPELFCRNPQELCGCRAKATTEQYDAYNWHYGHYLETMDCFLDQPSGEKNVWECSSYFWNGSGNRQAYWDAGGTNPLGFPIQTTQSGQGERACGPALWARPNLNGGCISNTTPPAGDNPDPWLAENPPWSLYGINFNWGWSLGRFGSYVNNAGDNKGFFDAICKEDNACGRCGQITSNRRYGDCIITIEGSYCPTDGSNEDNVPFGGGPVGSIGGPAGSNSGLPYDEYSLRNPYNPLNCWYEGDCPPGEQPSPNVNGNWLPNENETLVSSRDGRNMTRNPNYEDGFTMDANYQEVR